MKKVKLESRIENAVNAFFEKDEQFENTQLAFSGNHTILENERAKSFTEKADSIINIFKYLLFFLPGAFSLYFFTLLFTFFLPEMRTSSSMLVGMLIYLSAGSFMTVAGIGSVKEFKNLIVPGSIIAFSAIVAAIVSFLPLSQPMKTEMCFYYSMYLFPIALIIANLAKNWVNEK